MKLLQCFRGKKKFKNMIQNIMNSLERDIKIKYLWVDDSKTINSIVNSTITLSQTKLSLRKYLLAFC